MTGTSIRRAAASAAVTALALGGVMAGAGAAGAATPASSGAAVSVAPTAGSQAGLPYEEVRIGWYSTLRKCIDVGQSYQREGFDDYRCVPKNRGYILFVINR
ncbi:hypothetical protein [Streptomyces sp. I05A-00742]|uniref:hypothetical protein n=1 Tax=Streptomyces sp. I05A-00742 TaxID=2732853 RepID=UPI0014899C86|nr:hypothetical protein [Streptomyces sp. I05A-00742]